MSSVVLNDENLGENQQMSNISFTRGSSHVKKRDLSLSALRPGSFGRGLTTPSRPRYMSTTSNRKAFATIHDSARIRKSGNSNMKTPSAAHMNHHLSQVTPLFNGKKTLARTRAPHGGKGFKFSFCVLF